VGKSVGLSLTGRSSTGAWRAVVCGVWSVGGSGERARWFMWRRRFSVRSRTTPLRRSMHAISTAAERGQVPEREGRIQAVSATNSVNFSNGVM